MQAKTGQGWHVANWGLWGWVETVLKLTGIAAAIIAFFNSPADADLITGGSPRLAALIILGLLAVGMTGAFIWRIIQQEIISVIFSVFNVTGHFAALTALLRDPSQTTLLVVFALFFVLGELAKQRFLMITQYTEGGQTPETVVAFARGTLGTYILLLVALLL